MTMNSITCHIDDHNQIHILSLGHDVDKIKRTIGCSIYHFYEQFLVCRVSVEVRSGHCPDVRRNIDYAART